MEAPNQNCEHEAEAAFVLQLIIDCQSQGSLVPRINLAVLSILAHPVYHFSQIQWSRWPQRLSWLAHFYRIHSDYYFS
jgi:hypothetical protein